MAAEEAGLTVSGGASGTDYKYEDNTYTILTGTELTISGTTTTDNIVVGENVTANIIFNDLSIKFDDGGNPTKGTCAFYIYKKAHVTVTITGTNTIQSGALLAGIQIEKDAFITIQGGGTLTAQGGWGGAGIGAGKETSCGTININSGTVNAFPGGWAFGLGGGCFLDMEPTTDAIININGGIVSAGGKEWGSSSINGTININGGEITTSYHTHISYTQKYNHNFNGPLTITGGTFNNNNTFDNETTIKGGTFANCTLEGEVIIKGGTFANCIFTKETIVHDGILTDCKLDGTIIINKGTIQGTSQIICNPTCVINGGTINLTLANDLAPICVHTNNTLTINGGVIFAQATSQWTCAIGSNRDQNTGSIVINGGTIKAVGPYGGSGIGARDINNRGGYITINGGSIWTSTGGDYAQGVCGQKVTINGGSVFGSISNAPKNLKNENIYLAVSPKILNVTDVSVDGKPYYISGNHDSDDKLYLYMTGDYHTVTVRTSGSNDVTTYQATYKSGGVDSDGTGKGYFTFDSGTSSTPSDNSSVAFDLTDYKMSYGTDKLIVTLTVTNKAIKTRSAAMNSVQLMLTDEENNVLLSDQKGEVEKDKYEFEFDTKKLNTGTYTLTAQYGGSSGSNPSSKLEVPLTIVQAEGSEAPEYEDPTLTAIYKDKLSDIQLPTGWTWNVADTKIEVGTVGEKIFAAVFTPKDTKNYKVISKDLTITVGPLFASNLDDPKVISPELMTYGIKLSEIEITDGWKWVDENTIPEVSYWAKYQAFYEIEDDINYDWSKISGYDEKQHRVIREIKPDIEKAYLEVKDFIFTPPKNLIYDGQDKKAKVEMKNKDIVNVSIYIYYYDINKNELYDFPKDPGTYTISIDIWNNNYAIKGDELTDPNWTFTIKEQHNITIDHSITNGTVTANKEKAIEGETVTLTVSPTSGYECESLSCTKTDGTIVSITNKTFIMPESDVTVTATFKKATVTPPDPVDPTPPVDPDPSPVHYTVTLPAVEGATTDPSAGSHKVKKSDDFIFSLIVQEGYQKNSVPLVTARGEVITPRVSDGKYILPDVRNDVDIEIAGIVPDDDTANVSLPSGFRITAIDGILRITAPYATRLYLIDTSGRLILTRSLPIGDTRIEGLAAGVYLLTLEGQPARKILLK